ncbi:MAG: hypothetical protein HZB53_06815 [Chloroflexi bacterium]|nr:hypothetical protein [Chloroflexota bacterium]
MSVATIYADNSASSPLNTWLYHLLSSVSPTPEAQTFDVADSGTALFDERYSRQLHQRISPEDEWVISSETINRARKMRGEISRDMTTESIDFDAAIRLLRLWQEGDENEQRDTWEFLQLSLDQDRLSDRKLFP